MSEMHVFPSKLGGILKIPPSKSHTLRAILFASMARGKSYIRNYLHSPDTVAMIHAMRMFGAQIEVQEGRLTIIGINNHLKVPNDIVQCGNSGQVLRFVGALAGLLPHYTILTGDDSIRTNRVVRPLLDGLTQLGAFAVSSRENDLAPIIVKGPLIKRYASIDGTDSQPVSGLLIAGAFSEAGIDLNVLNPGEKPWVDLTLHWFSTLGIEYRRTQHTRYEIKGNGQIEGFEYEVPGDLSSAAFPIVGALITQSELTVENVDMLDCQGDKQLIFILQKMGAQFEIHPEKRKLIVKKGKMLQGLRIDVNDCIDALPILAVVGCFATSKTELINGSIARNKESNRIETIAKELRKMGANIEEKEDGLVIYPSPLKGAFLHSHEDHRIALALAIASLGASQKSVILNAICMKKTYGSFQKDFQSIGAHIESTEV